MKYAPKVSISVIGESALTGGRIPEFSDVRFLCKADANPPNVTYRWYINEELVAGDYTTEMVSLFVYTSMLCYEPSNRKHRVQSINMSLCNCGKWECNLKVNDPKCLSTKHTHTRLMFKCGVAGTKVDRTHITTYIPLVSAKFSLRKFRTSSAIHQATVPNEQRGIFPFWNKQNCSNNKNRTFLPQIGVYSDRAKGWNSNAVTGTSIRNAN